MKNSKGFTLIELVIVIGIISILIGFTMINLVSIQTKTNVSTTTDILISDISSQQNKAMTGMGSTVASDYGIYFETGRYTLFNGSSYNPTDSNNYVVTLNGGYSLADSFAGDTLVFSAITGEVKNFVDGQSSIEVKRDSGTDSKTITINRYGVVVLEN